MRRETTAGKSSRATTTIDLRGQSPLITQQPTDPVPFLDLKTQHRDLHAEILAVWGEILESAGFIGGRHVSGFETALAQFVGVDYVISAANGTEAITLALKGLGIAPGDEVITAANTFFATVEAIVHAGGRPVLVDVDPDTATIDPVAVERAITPRTKFIVPVHLYGQPADMDEIMELAGRHGLKVVEDNAQALGARYKGRRTGSIGHVAATSFYPGKNLGACGDGGAVTTNDPDVAAKIRVLANHGQAQKYEHVMVGYNSRLDALQAAALAIKLPFLDGWNEARAKLAADYRWLLADTALELPVERSDRSHVYHLFVVRHPQRAQIMAKLDASNVGTGMHYPVPIHLTKPFLDLGEGPGSFPVAEMWAFNGFSLPMFPTLEVAEVQIVAENIIEALGGAHVLASETL